MTTELKRFSGPYATMTVAAYEPLIIDWISGVAIRFIAAELATRDPKAGRVVFDPTKPTALPLASTVRPETPARRLATSVEQPAPGIGGRTRAATLSADAVPDPGLTVLTSAQATTVVPITVSARLGVQQSVGDFVGTRNALLTSLTNAALEWARTPQRNLAQLMAASTGVTGAALPHLWPDDGGLQKALSPIGIAHYYRQLYFHMEEGVGPIEEAFTVAPLETLEVIYQTIRKQIHEEILEQGLEVVSESAVEEKNLDEVSDKVSSMVQQDVGAAMSANASGSVGVWQVGASASATFGSSSQRSREYCSRRLKDVTTRASERITKSFTIKTRDTTELTETSTTRRVIRNDGASPVSYGLRRVLRRVNVKVQDLGPRLVWQVYVRNPGGGLARSRFVHFREAAPISVPEIPPGVPPRPAPSTDSGSVQAPVLSDEDGNLYWVTIVIKPGADRVVTGVRIDGISDLEGGGKEDPAPVPRNDYELSQTWDAATNTFTAKIAIYPGDSGSVQVAYTYTYEPSNRVLAEWEAQRQAAVTELTEDALTKQFERHRALITQRSKVKSRPASDLRREERYEVMNRMVSYLFGRGDDPSEPTPLEIEYFHRYFEIDAIFNYNHPSWWKPRFSSTTGALEREAYEVTAESEPAALGSSLGWQIQLDGDRRRNEFLNSPWTRVCVPIRPNREREAVDWLAKHLEGEIGYSAKAGKQTELLAYIEAYRAREEQIGLGGPDYVTVESTPGAPTDPATPEGVYPIVQEFDVTVPTDGFVFDELRVVIP